MTKVTLYSVWPVLIAGFQVIVDSLDGFAVSVCSSLTHPMNHSCTERPRLIVFAVTSTNELDTLDTLRKVIECYQDAAVILWADDVSAEFAAQAISLGVRGLLRRRLTARSAGALPGKSNGLEVVNTAADSQNEVFKTLHSAQRDARGSKGLRR